MRVTARKILGPASKFLLVPVILGKVCLHHLYRENEGPLEVVKSVINYDEPAGKEAMRYITSALQAFFLVTKLAQKRSSVIFRSGAIRLLIYSSDAGTALGATMVYLLTGLSVGGIYH